jgi:hypothetical protein
MLSRVERSCAARNLAMHFKIDLDLEPGSAALLSTAASLGRSST